jgi:hypothetical protein
VHQQASSPFPWQRIWREKKSSEGV